MQATEFGLTDLERDLDQRTVTLTMLSRLHDPLGLSLDETLLTDRAAKGLAEHDPDAVDDIDAAMHARTLLAVLVSRDGIGVDVVLAATRWSLAEFEAGLTYLRAQLDRTASQVLATDVVPHLALRPGVLPGPLRVALARPTAMRRGAAWTLTPRSSCCGWCARRFCARSQVGRYRCPRRSTPTVTSTPVGFSMPELRSGAAPNLATSSRSASTTTTGSTIPNKPLRACGSIPM
ncbi:hypothetical protein AB0G00_12500 [Nocardia salmonicida]|uniref:hypothetical protein n=1 Tax=Nocardia salmonicida TaxID=53431 RepID=UPI0033C8B65E